ncbi:MAG TPA: TRAP transporter large permease subunit, partial [Burkholderiaceae bacterium]|nr:TRAP transporter large permease subunit [Burkholderiaceae bacterium]
MDWTTALLLLTGSLVVLLALGLPVALTFFGVNILGAIVFMHGEIGLNQMTRNVVTAITNYNLAPIPLFILMGEILLHSGVAIKAIDAIDRLISRVPGRMAVVSVTAGTVFSALSGSSIANTAMLGRSLMPMMLDRGYHPTLSMGPIMAAGAIAMLIPPSALAVLVGSLAGMSISRLLLAGITPALIMSAFFVAYIVIRAKRRPQDAPPDEHIQRSLKERWMPFVIYVLPLSGILFVVVGSLVLGWATPTESAGLGVIASFIATICYRCLNWEVLKKTLAETSKTSTMILFIIMASTTFSQILSFSGATNGIVSVVSAVGAEPLWILVMMGLVLLVLGSFVDQASMVMITVPIFIPIAKAVGIDPLWLGVIYLITMEMSFLTPPFGLLLFVMKGIAPPSIRISTVYRAAAP